MQLREGVLCLVWRGLFVSGDVLLREGGFRALGLGFGFVL